jgi:hypothetical protein
VFDRYGSPCGAHSEASLQRQIERLAQEFVLQCLSRSTAAASCAAVDGGPRRGGGSGFPGAAMISKSDGPGVLAESATVIPDDADANTAGFALSAAQGAGSPHAGGHRRESDHDRSNQNRPRIFRKRSVAEN